MSFKLSTVSQKPVAVVYTPNSILSHSEVPFRSLKMPNNRSRYSTCTDVAWINNNRHLAVLNLANESLQIYEFNNKNYSLKLIQNLDNQDGMQFHEPDKFSFSPNGLFLANTNNKKGYFSANLYQIDPQTQMISPNPIQVVKHAGDRFHGIRFSTNSKYLICTTIGNPGNILVYKLENRKNGSAYLKFMHEMKNPYFPLKPKSINFSKDGSLMVACFSGNAGRLSSLPEGALAIYNFDNNTGKIDTKPVCELKGRPEISFTDDVSFSQDEMSSFIVLPSQLNDSLVIYPFDVKKKQVDMEYVTISNPKAQISYPHGIALSSDNKFLAVSHYGDDKVTIYLLNN
jgi:6-phosphogluconolactonase (cycloisomerase 2 family)